MSVVGQVAANLLAGYPGIRRGLSLVLRSFLSPGGQVTGGTQRTLRPIGGGFCQAG